MHQLMDRHLVWLSSCFILGFITLSGCAVSPAPYLPSTWISQTPTIRTSAKQVKQAKLQVFITNSHTALRLVSSNSADIFWDPGGEYGLFDDDWGTRYLPLPEKIERANDLIVSTPPNMETFVNWRWIVEDLSVEVFEWDLSDLKARSLRQVLLHGTDDTHPAGSFSTWTFPLFCTIATSDFLQRFASPMIQISKTFLFPSFLAKALYSQTPSRVYVFTWDGQSTVYTPPGPTSARQ